MSPKKERSPSKIYSTARGSIYCSCVEEFLNSSAANAYRGKVRLLITSPPFPLNHKKKYGNLKGIAYLNWLADFAPAFRKMLTPGGSIVLELGNAWEPGRPVMSTLALEALLAFKTKGKLRLVQQFVAHNPARLPSPAQWVNIERIRVKDSFTHLWWLAPSDRPYSDNRSILIPYSSSMESLLKSKRYNSGTRPSGHRIGSKSFLKNNGGSIPSNVLTFSNTSSNDAYQEYCRRRELKLHPARMQSGVAEFFIKFLTRKGDVVFDPFAGSNTTGAAAENLKRNWISVEANRDYIIGSRGRF
jgi:DNA modification methylase